MINRKEFYTGTGTLLTPLSINLSYQHQPKPHLNLVAHTFNKYRKPVRLKTAVQARIHRHV
jgi:hypothetical protein